MTTLEQLSLRGSAAVRALRLQKFRADQPFMIYTRTLPSHQFYLEFANGLMQLAEIRSDGQGYRIIRDLSQNETVIVRQKFQFA